MRLRIPFSPTSALVAAACLVSAFVLPACAGRTARVSPGRPALDRQTGIASFYGRAFHGRTTADGTRFNMHAMTAAHPSYAFGTRVRVTNIANGRNTVVTINDRGPARRPIARGVIIDLSYGAARRLGFVRQGLQRVRVEVVSWGRRRR